MQLRPTPEPSAREWLDRLGRRELSSRELVAHVLARIDAANPGLNALVARDDEAALAAADEADAIRRQASDRPLLGLPITIKDSIDAAGLVGAGGSLARASRVPAHDATVVARLRAAGAIPIGKTNVPEYTWSYETENVVYGRTVNPADRARTCGGSSGGEAALLGADASVVGIGTDGGGSIRIPAHYCGTVGLRPTAGLVPETGCWPSTRDTGMLDMNAVGPMARFVEDIALLLPAIAGSDNIDPFVQGVVPGDAGAVDVSGLRVGFYSHDGVRRVSPGTSAAVECAAQALASSGCAVEEAAPPQLSDATELFFGLMAADGGAQARSDLAGANGRHVPQLATLLEEIRLLGVDATGLFALTRRLFKFRAAVRAFVGRYDVVIAPVTTGAAPPHGCTPGDDTPLESYLPFNYTHALSLAGLPVVVVRAGQERDLPIGVQVIASAFHDHVALAAAAAIERVRGGFPGAPQVDSISGVS